MCCSERWILVADRIFLVERGGTDEDVMEDAFFVFRLVLVQILQIDVEARSVNFLSHCQGLQKFQHKNMFSFNVLSRTLARAAFIVEYFFITYFLFTVLLTATKCHGRKYNTFL